MFPIALIRHKDPELFIGIAAPVGANIDVVCDSLSDVLHIFKYNLESIRVIDELKQVEGYLNHDFSSYDEILKDRMDEGDKFRTELERDDALSLLSLSRIRRFRQTSPTGGNPIPRQAYLFRSLKRPEEVTALRRIYGSNFILIGVHCGREERVNNLAKRIAESRFSAQHDQYRDISETLVLRDESDELKIHGQRLRSAFAMADFFIESSDPPVVRRELERFLNLLFGKPVITPSKDEIAMAFAYTAAMRSAELGRQVGAAIADNKGNLIAVGMNEVPKAGGGFYWDGDDHDARDWSRDVDSSDYFKNANMGELLQALTEHKLLSPVLRSLATPEQIKKLTPLIKHTRYMQLIEFIRAVHAEMGALTDAAYRGVPVQNCTMYVTTFPCHECARNLIAAGISKVVYVEPYSKSLALELQDHAIQMDSKKTEGKIPFVPFLGVAPRNYFDIFGMPERKKNGRVISWNAEDASPRVSGSFWSYLEYEKEDLNFLTARLKKKGLNLNLTGTISKDIKRKNEGNKRTRRRTQRRKQAG